MIRSGLAAIALALTGTACGTHTEAAPETVTEMAAMPEALIGVEWVVEDISGAGVIDTARATLQFGGDGRLSGIGSCNPYFGSWTLDGDTVSISQLGSGRKLCPPAVMDQEQKFFGLLSVPLNARMDETEALILEDGAGGSILARRSS